MWFHMGTHRKILCMRCEGTGVDPDTEEVCGTCDGAGYVELYVVNGDSD